MTRICSEDNCSNLIAQYSRSGICSKHYSRRYARMEQTKERKNRQHIERRSQPNVGLSECGSPMCEEQKRKTLLRPCDWYKNHNKCLSCNVLWEKPLDKCPHCNRKLRLKPKNKNKKRREEQQQQQQQQEQQQQQKQIENLIVRY